MNKPNLVSGAEVGRDVVAQVDGQTNMSRRQFVLGSAAMAGGGLALGLNLTLGAGDAVAQAVDAEVTVWAKLSCKNTSPVALA